MPFEAPALRMARVCEDEQDGLIAILRNFANNGAAYIIPWTSLPLVVAMTDHDAALHKGVGERRPSTSAEVRAVVSELALSGALGPEAKARELERALADTTQLGDIQLALVLHLLSCCGADLATLTADLSRWGASNAKAVVAAAAAMGVRRQDIYRRVSEFAQLLLPIGLTANAGPAHPGWLRVLNDEIDAFGRRYATAGQAGSPEIDTALADIAKSAIRTAQLSSAVLSMIDYAILDISATITRWNTEQPVLRQAIDRLSLILEEWPALMKGVHDATRAPQGDVAAQLLAVRAVLPHAPDVDLPADSDVSAGHAGLATVSQLLSTKLTLIWSMLSTSCRTATGTDDGSRSV